MKKSLLLTISAFLIILSLASPQKAFALVDCTGPGTQGSCPSGYTCTSTVGANGAISTSCVQNTTTKEPAALGTDVRYGNCINTAIGCIPVLSGDNGVDFSTFILKWAIGAGGGIAFLLILYAGFMVMTSTGNPERLKAGQELLTSAISGIILLIFSVFILNFIGIKILGIFT